MNKYKGNIYASELKAIFDVYGHFYDLKISDKIFKCRSLLEIKRKGVKIKNETPDIVVIMMNPGSSKPLEKSYIPKTFTVKSYSNLRSKETVPTRPDNAQYQLMRLMVFNDWNFVKVLNLSDLRNGNSGDFQKDFLESKNFDKSDPHCITHKKRRRELLDSLRSKTGKIIAAWGSINLLKDSAESVLKLDKEIIGIVNGSLPNYRYASPLMQVKKEEWLREIQRLILKK
ncbi:MAG TPA: hypothetical protein PKA90_11905 [Ignavibacteria bacterium]|nr:hypothetical protein [Ignavibacteria bacterium]HMR41124.1 hypothetical protein [Ignavibacteria bacterium]